MSEEVTVAELPYCDLCRAFGKPPTPASYDARTKQGPWAYLCEEHWETHGVSQLGTGYGQRLVVKP